MATMEKQKDRHKKKNKQKTVIKANEIEDPTLDISFNLVEPSISKLSIDAENAAERIQNIINCDNISHPDSKEISLANQNISENSNVSEQSIEYSKMSTEVNTQLSPESIEITLEKMAALKAKEEELIKLNMAMKSSNKSQILVHQEKMAEIKAREEEVYKLNVELMASMKALNSQSLMQENVPEKLEAGSSVENITPSAPMLEEEIQVIKQPTEDQKVTSPKVQCMPIEQAVMIYGGTEMSAVKAMSEREEGIVEAGPVSGPDHQLVDLLSTFRTSLRALDNERSKLACGVADEEKSRSTLWKVEKRELYKEVECKCGYSVPLRAKYIHATYHTERLPVAKLKLESLLRDVQDSYCHHQHTVLLTHYQIEELISETIESNKPAIREALSLILQALKVSDHELLATALQRWAAALVAALVDQRDVRQILFVIHHLFRQSRSVSWAAKILQPGPGTPTTVAVLDILLAGSKKDCATECTEDMEDAWEEVLPTGASGAVSEDCLRETDLLSLLHAFPIRDIIANIVMIRSRDTLKASPLSWGDVTGGRDVMTACCGARTLLLTSQRAILAHPHYHTLHETLRQIAATLLKALHCFCRSTRVRYTEELAVMISAELEACFVAAFKLCGTRDLHTLNTAVLPDETARDYCLTFIAGLHDKSPRRISSLSVDAPTLPCAMRVRIVTSAAVFRDCDHELARMVLDFLFQTGIKNKSPVCTGGCAAEARACLPTLLASHEYLRTVALYNIAEVAKAESLDASVITTLSVKSWRPQPDELSSLLNEWARRCPNLLPDLMMEIDCTPYSGISHASQLSLLQFLVQWGGPVEGRWRALRRLRTHASCWRSTPCVQGPDTVPADMFECAFTLLATQWGCSVPLICAYGVCAVSALLPRPREAIHCLAPLMLVMAHSPDSISYTPKFNEIFTTLLNTGPSLVQRAFGRGGASGSELVLRLALAQLDNKLYINIPRSQILSAWLHALSRCNAPLMLDSVAAAAREWATIDAHAAMLIQEENAKDYINTWVRNASTAPLFCESLLRAHYTHAEFNTRMFGALSNAVYQQHTCGQKIHVDNALQKMKWLISSEELTIYRCAAAALSAPLHHPAHLTLWRLLLHLYLQRPPEAMHDAIIPVGPLFFSGIKKSRTIGQIKKRLQETADYHHNEIETYKKALEESIQDTNRVERTESISRDTDFLPELTIKDLTGESDHDSDLDTSEDVTIEDQKDDDVEKERQRLLDMQDYHMGAERMISEYIVWLDEGDKVRASPHHADIARFIPEQALEAAWRSLVARIRPPPSELDEFPHPLPPPPPAEVADNSPLKLAVDAISGIEDNSGVRSRRLIKSPLGEVDFKDMRRLLAVVDKHLKDIDTLTKEWRKEVTFISTLDKKLWELTASLRVSRTVSLVIRQCPNVIDGTTCKKQVKFYFTESEWCISTGTERAIKENRSSWLSGVRRLSRARPQAARTSAALLSIARRIEDSGAAKCAVERAFVYARDEVSPIAAATVTAFVQLLAERCINADGESCAALVRAWGDGALRQAMCGALVSPQQSPREHWHALYNAVLETKLPPHTKFSYLSKFDMVSWSRSIAPNVRRDLLASLILKQEYRQDNKLDSAQSDMILLELLGVHTSVLVNATELYSVVMRFNEATVSGRIPAQQWVHLNRAVAEHASELPFDELGHLLRDIGTLWLKARESQSALVACYAPHVARLLYELLRAFVAACVALSFNSIRVGVNTWSAVRESWGPWVTPPSLLPSLNEPHYSEMVQHFLDCLRQLIEYYPKMTEELLQNVFSWCVHVHAHAQTTLEERAQAAELLHAIETLPWEQLTLSDACLNAIVQVSAADDKEIQRWASVVMRQCDARAILYHSTDESVTRRLVTLLHLFTATNMNHSVEILEQATLLPWQQLPEEALAGALERFFMLHYDSNVPHHQSPQFRVLLYASELKTPSRLISASKMSGKKRACAVSQWTRAIYTSSEEAIIKGDTAALLRIIDEVALQMENSSKELEDLLGRASVMMCMDPAAIAALPVWLEYISTASLYTTGALISAACSLTRPLYAAKLSDAAIKRHMSFNESGWSAPVARWMSRSPWHDPTLFLTHACAHAAYACACAHRAPQPPLIRALLTCTINFVEEEVVVAVWICYVCRVALDCATSAATTVATDSATSIATESATSVAKGEATRIDKTEREETVHAALTLLSTWAQTQRRSLLKVVTLQADNDRPTPQHRLLCRLAECIITRSKDSIQNYSNAVTSLGLSGDVTGWGASGEPSSLTRLAVRLYPKHERYFTEEIKAFIRKL